MRRHQHRGPGINNSLATLLAADPRGLSADCEIIHLHLPVALVANVLVLQLPVVQIVLDVTSLDADPLA